MFAVHPPPMPDAVRELYSQHRYPALSHPETHPGVLAATARCAGVVSPALPESCRLLELGCASGHNLLPLAARFPESTFHGVDFSDSAIHAAQAAARAAGLENITFEHADLRDWAHDGEPFDYIIAQGLLSWVADDAKASLLDLVARHLAPSGIACIDYNTLPGWSLRKEAAEMVRALGALTPEGQGLDGLLKTLADTAALTDTPHSQQLATIFRDMRRKGPAVLPFDDLAPVCDPLHFTRVLTWTGQRKLRYLGESTLAGNLPPHLSPDVHKRLAPLSGDPVLFQQTLDLLSGRTHRTSLFCPAATEIDTRTTTSVVLHFEARQVVSKIPDKAVTGDIVGLLHASLNAAAPASRPVTRLMEECARRLGNRWDPAAGSKAVAAWLYQAARLGWVELRADAIDIPPIPGRPALSPLNLHFAKSGSGIVDAFHRTCHFPAKHQPVVAALDGTRPIDELEAFARATAPDLDFHPWLRHLAGRGLFPG